MIKRLLAAWLTFNGGGGSSSSTTQQKYSPVEEYYRNKTLDTGARLYSKSVAGGAPEFLTPSDATQQAQSQALNFANTTGADYSTQVGNALKFGMSDVLNPATNPALQGTLDTATRRLNEAYTAPGGPLSSIRTNFTAGNSGGSGTREGIAMGLAARSHDYALGDTYSDILNNAYNQGLSTFRSTLALAPQSYAAMMAPTQTVAGVGEAQDQYAAAKQNWDMNIGWSMLQPWANLQQGIANPSVVSTTTGAQANPFTGALGGAAMGAYVGSVVPGIGTAVGAGAGALLGLLSAT